MPYSRPGGIRNAGHNGSKSVELLLSLRLKPNNPAILSGVFNRQRKIYKVVRIAACSRMDSPVRW